MARIGAPRPRLAALVLALAVTAPLATAARSDAIALPRAGDVITYAVSASGAEPGALELSWDGVLRGPDRFGVERSLDHATGRAAGARFSLAFEPGTASLVSRTLDVPATKSQEDAMMPEATRVVFRERSFEPAVASLEGCLVRAEWQGLAMRALHGLDLYEACPAARAPGATDAAPLAEAGVAQWADESARVFEAAIPGATARFAFVADLAYPVAASVTWEDGSVAYELRNLVYGDGDAPTRVDHTDTIARPGVTFHPIERWGVVEGDPGAYHFPPSEAIAAIEREPIGYRQYAESHPSARVVAWRYFENEHTSPAGSGAIPAWRFLLNDETGQGFEVTVRRAPIVRPGALPTLGVGEVAHGVESARVTLPPLDPATLPARSLSVPDMIEAWHGLAGADAPPANRIGARLQPDLPESDEPGLSGRDAFVGHVAYGASVGASDPLAPSWDENSVNNGLIIELATGAAVRAFERRADGHTWLAPLAPELASAAPVRGRDVDAARDLTLILVPVAGATLLAFLAWYFLAPLYTRLPSEGVIRNAKRAAIVALVNAEPGVHMSALRERTALGGGALAYHLAVLERTRHVTRVKSGGYVRFFPAGKLAPGDMRERATILAGSHARILESVRERPGITQQELAAALGVSRVAVHRAAARLETAGLVRRARDGRSIRVFVR